MESVNKSSTVFILKLANYFLLNIIFCFRPRAASVAERLWSNQTLTDPGQAAPRLEELRCRMIKYAHLFCIFTILVHNFSFSHGMLFY